MLLSVLRELLQKETGEKDFLLEEPPGGEKQGDFATNIAFLMAKREKTSPLVLAQRLAQTWRGHEVFERVETAPPGFINFYIAREAVIKEFQMMLRAGKRWGKVKPARRETVIVEYSSPNIAKPMHVGHLRSTIIGDALANLYEFLGHKVIRWNYLGDWGTQFGKLIAAFKLWGNKKDLVRKPIETMLQLYIRFHQEAREDPNLVKQAQAEFQKLEKGHQGNKKLWQWFRRVSLKEFNRIYKLLGITFDVVLGESFYERDLPLLVARLKQSGLARESEGALIIPLETVGLPPALIRKSDGATLYLTREIANLEYRLKRYRPTRILYVVANEQTLHFSQLFAIARLMGLTASRLEHIKFGMVLGPDGRKFSTREGGAVVLEDLITQAVNLARQVVESKNPGLPQKEKEKIASVVGVGALKYNDLSQNRIGDITFNWEKMLSLTGNSAPYLQYTYARLKSILRKAGSRKYASVKLFSHLKSEPAKYLSPADRRLIIKLAQFPEVVGRSAQEYLPNYLANYLYSLSQGVNNFYETSPILESEPIIRSFRLQLIKIVAETLKNGLNLLGIQTLERM